MLVISLFLRVGRNRGRVAERPSWMWAQMFLEAHFTCTLTCLHLALPGVQRLLFNTVLHIHLIGSFPPGNHFSGKIKEKAKWLRWQVPWLTEQLSGSPAKSYFLLVRKHPFALCNSWVDHKKVKIANVYGTLPLIHSNSLIYRYRNHYFLLLPGAQL